MVIALLYVHIPSKSCDQLSEVCTNMDNYYYYKVSGQQVIATTKLLSNTKWTW